MSTGAEDECPDAVVIFNTRIFGKVFAGQIYILKTNDKWHIMWHQKCSIGVVLYKFLHLTGIVFVPCPSQYASEEVTNGQISTVQH